MSDKKYDLSQVSQDMKDTYLQAIMDFDRNRSVEYDYVQDVWQALCLEAEVKPKTAREILQGFLDSSYAEDGRAEARLATNAISEALKVLP